MIKNIQALRALAAVMVVFVHLKILLDTIGLPLFGGAGVDLFFVISGFVMVHTTQKRPPSPSEFIRNRIARVVPVYWFMTLGVYGLALLAPRLLGATSGNVAELCKSLLFIPFRKASGFVEPVLFVGWTLNYEMFFYVLFALGLFARRYLVGLCSVVAILFALVLSGWLLSPKGVLAAFYTNPILLEFALGMGVALLTERAPKIVSSNVRWLAICCLIAVPSLFIAPLIWPSLPTLLTSGVPAAIAVSDAVLLERWGLSMKNILVLAVGNASYILYLSHPFVTQSFQKIGEHLHSNGVTSGMLIVLCCVAIICVALLLHRFIEKPLSRVAKQVLCARRLPPQPA